MTKRHNVGALPTSFCAFEKLDICTKFLCANFKTNTISLLIPSNWHLRTKIVKALTIDRHLVCQVHIRNMELRDDSALLWPDETMMISLPLTKTIEELLHFFQLFNLMKSILNTNSLIVNSSDQQQTEAVTTKFRSDGCDSPVSIVKNISIGVQIAKTY